MASVYARFEFQRELRKESHELYNKWLAAYGFESRIARLSNNEVAEIQRVANRVRGSAC